jgi:hypothetical protein
LLREPVAVDAADSTDGTSGEASMTTSNDMGVAPQPGADEPPVWQPLPVAEPVETSTAEDPATGIAYEQVVVSASRAGSSKVARRANSVTGLLLVSTMIALAGVAFAAGRVTATGQSGTGQTTNGIGGANGQNGVPNFVPNASGVPNFDLGGRDRGLNGPGGTVTGTVTGVTSTSITVQLADGQTTTVAIGSSTTYHTQTAGNSGDVTQGSTVTIRTTGTEGAAAVASAGATTRTATDVTVTR